MAAAMTGMATRGLIVLASFAFVACVLDFDGLSGGAARPGDGGPDDAQAPADAAPDGDATSGETSTNVCPGAHGPTAVRVTDGATTFCIDATEVTNGQYAEFLAANPPSSNQFSACSDNTSFTPDGDWPGDPTLPVVRVDWCDAYAFCTWAGKRLCGRIGADHLALADRNDATASQWFFACSMKGTKTYPYGATYDANACVFGSGRQAAGSKQTCEGGFPGVFDMSGNVEEWVDECANGFSDCLARGADYSTPNASECATAATAAQPRMLKEPWRGFRCCSP
jgi:sulfatase modifying factor 1